MDLTYPEIGATRSDDAELPRGYHHVRRHARAGSGGQEFARAVAGLRAWQMYREAGLAVRPGDGAVAQDAEIAVGMGVGPLRLWAPGRVVWVDDEPARFGYGYGTLPGHPESGEEAFVLTLDADGVVWFDVRAFSLPATWYTRLGGPLSRMVQEYWASRYVRAVRRLARGPASLKRGR